MALTFPSFPDLPTELRLEIWKSSARDSRKGVHFFAICTESSCLIPPVFDDNPWRPWQQRNPSTYDFGLWAACEESAFVAREQLLRSRRLDTGTSQIGTHCLRVGGVEAALGFFTDTDLRVFQIPRGETGPAIEVLLSCSSYGIGGTRRDGSAWIEGHVGFEYDDSWTFDPEEENVNDLADRVAGPRGLFLWLLREIIRHEIPAHLYIINYGLYLGKDQDRTRRMKFHGNGCDFLVADCWETDPIDRERRYAWNFLLDVAAQAEVLWRDLGPGDVYEAIWNKTDVLVCEVPVP